MIKTNFKNNKGVCTLKISFGYNYFLLLTATPTNNGLFLVNIKKCNNFNYVDFPFEYEFKEVDGSPKEYSLEESFLEQDLFKIGVEYFISTQENITKEEYSRFLDTYKKIENRFCALDELVCYLKSKNDSFQRGYDTSASAEYGKFEEDSISFGGENYYDKDFRENSFSFDELTTGTFIIDELCKLKNEEKQKQTLRKQQMKKERAMKSKNKIIKEKHERAEYERLKAKFEKGD